MEIPKAYEGDIKRFKQWTVQNRQAEGVKALLLYLKYRMEVDGIKKSTWERNLHSIRKYLTVEYGMDIKGMATVNVVLASMRRDFKTESHIEQTKPLEQRLIRKEVLLEKIKALPVREKAIYFVNLITGNLPSEMVRMKIGHFDFDKKTVQVFRSTQNVWHTRALTPEAIEFVKDYVKAYNLSNESYFVGRVFKGGRYSSQKISDIGYNKNINKWLGCSTKPVVKAQVNAMHGNGAEPHTIMAHIGRKDITSFLKHNLSISESTIRQYI